MPLPVNIRDLVNGRSVEWDRLEFKKGWNPLDVLHTICAFANDINNWAGGYIIIGIEETDGLPVLPPLGLLDNHIDAIQKRLLELTYRITPNYFPVSQPFIYDGKSIFVIWVPAGDVRPYSAPESFGKTAQRNYYIRHGSNTVAAKGERLGRLLELTAKVPFDDRINQVSGIENLDLGLIRQYLQRTRSGLFDESSLMSHQDLCRTMQIARGPDENLRCINVGLMFFNQQPELYFQRAWIEVVIHHDESGKQFEEKYFKGPLDQQLREALAFLRSQVVREQIVKIAGQAEAHRFFNYPFEAIEEAVCNAVYHKSYESPAPIEIQVFGDKITVLSFPGPLPPVTAMILATERRVIARDYRNRRIGDFLKELDFTEGRATGNVVIHNSLKQNGSPPPTFETDDENRYLLVTLQIHEEFQRENNTHDKINDDVKLWTLNSMNDLKIMLKHLASHESEEVSNKTSLQVTKLVTMLVTKHTRNILSFCIHPQSRQAILSHINLTNQTKNYNSHFKPLIQNGWLHMIDPDNPKNPNQQYTTTDEGHLMLNILRAYKV